MSYSLILFYILFAAMLYFLAFLYYLPRSQHYTIALKLDVTSLGAAFFLLIVVEASILTVYEGVVLEKSLSNILFEPRGGPLGLGFGMNLFNYFIIGGNLFLICFLMIQRTKTRETSHRNEKRVKRFHRVESG